MELQGWELFEASCHCLSQLHRFEEEERQERPRTSATSRFSLKKIIHLSSNLKMILNRVKPR